MMSHSLINRYALLLAFVVFGGVYFVRSLGRSDGPHLDSAIPPVCHPRAGRYAHSYQVTVMRRLEFDAARATPATG